MDCAPNNREVAKIIAECFARAGSVPPGYTAERYLRDSASDSIPYIDPNSGAEALLACNADPLGLGAQ